MIKQLLKCIATFIFIILVICMMCGCGFTLKELCLSMITATGLMAVLLFCLIIIFVIVEISLLLVILALVTRNTRLFRGIE